MLNVLQAHSVTVILDDDLSASLLKRRFKFHSYVRRVRIMGILDELNYRCFRATNEMVPYRADYPRSGIEFERAYIRHLV